MVIQLPLTISVDVLLQRISNFSMEFPQVISIGTMLFSASTTFHFLPLPIIVYYMYSDVTSGAKGPIHSSIVLETGELSINGGGG